MRRLIVVVVALVMLAAGSARAAETLNAYSIWPENWAKPMFEEFEKATGIQVNFVRFSSGEALARVIAEKNNPRVDVLFGGPVETFAAGVKESVFEAYKPPSFAALPARFHQPDGLWVAMADDPLVFMSNNKFLKDKGLKPPASWEDLLDPAYRNQLQMADARTSGTAAEAIALLKGAKNPAAGKKLIDWATSPAMQVLYAKYKINFIPAHPEVKVDPGLAEVLKGAKIFPIDENYAGANRKRIVERWVKEIANP